MSKGRLSWTGYKGATPADIGRRCCVRSRPRPPRPLSEHSATTCCICLQSVAARWSRLRQQESFFQTESLPAAAPPDILPGAGTAGGRACRPHPPCATSASEDAEMPSPRFDRSLLPPADLEFVVVSDTHYMIDVGDAPLEFESRRRQGERAGAAWRAIASLDPAFVVHLGDMVQEFPGRPDYDRAVGEALGQIHAAGLWEALPLRGRQPRHRRSARPDHAHGRGDRGESRHLGAEARGRPGAPGPRRGSASSCSTRSCSTPAWLRPPGSGPGSRRSWWRRVPSGASCSCTCRRTSGTPASPGSATTTTSASRTAAGSSTWCAGTGCSPCSPATCTSSSSITWPARPASAATTSHPPTSFTRPGFSHLFTSAPPPEQGRDDAEKAGILPVPDDRRPARRSPPASDGPAGRGRRRLADHAASGRV